MTALATDHASFNDEQSFTTKETCKLKNLSKTAFYDLKNRGLGPKETRIPGTNIVRYTGKAIREWQARLDELSATTATDGDRARRTAQASKAGRKGAASPAHHCRRARAR